MDVSADYEDIK